MSVILLVEDDAMYTKLAKLLLGSLGHEVRVAGTADDALRSLREGRPDLLLMDVGLPGMSGFQAIEAIRRDPALAGLKAIGMTADRAWPEAERKARAAGFDTYIEKPVSFEAWRDVVAPFLPTG